LHIETTKTATEKILKPIDFFDFNIKTKLKNDKQNAQTTHNTNHLQRKNIGSKAIKIEMFR
jgi:hypothetical protein